MPTRASASSRNPSFRRSGFSRKYEKHHSNFTMDVAIRPFAEVGLAGVSEKPLSIFIMVAIRPFAEVGLAVEKQLALMYFDLSQSVLSQKWV